MNANYSVSSLTGFEDDIRLVLQVPEPDEEFLQNLRKEILGRTIKPPVIQGLRLRRSWAFSLTILAVLLGLILAIGPSKVWAAVRSLFGYIPGAGFVQLDTALRILEAPQSLERDGIKLTVEQIITDTQKTVVTYTVDGLTPGDYPAREDAPFCSDMPFLQLPDGTQLAAKGGEGTGWPGGFRTAHTFPAVPLDVSTMEFVLPCIQGTGPGFAPENWSIALRLAAAPADFEVFPVIEVGETGTATETREDTPLPLPFPGISFSLEKAVPVDGGYLLEGMLAWADEYDYTTFSSYSIEITSADGQRIAAEPQDLESDIDPYTEHRMEWAVLTGSMNYPSPWTITLPAVIEEKEVDVKVELDLGTAPVLGQVLELNQKIDVAGQEVLLTTAVLDTGKDGNTWLDLHFETDPGAVTGLSVWDQGNKSQGRIAGHGGGANGGFDVGWSYDYIPSGVITLTISNISLLHTGPWQLTWEPPATEGKVTENPQPKACLTRQGMMDLVNNPPAALPAGLEGKVLVEGPAPEGYHFPLLTVMNLDGSSPQVIGPGGWGTLSPDAGKAAFILSDGMYVHDLAAGVTTRLGWSSSSDYHPVWSPDGSRLAFQKSNGGVFIATLDENEMVQVPGTDASTQLIDWMPDGESILVSKIGSTGSQVQQITINTGQTQDIFLIDNLKGGFASLSPDGKWAAYSEKVFGQPAYGVFLAQVPSGEKRLVAALDGINATISGWSKDSTWLLLHASEYISYDSVKHYHFLVNPETCEVIYFPVAQGSISDWK